MLTEQIKTAIWLAFSEAHLIEKKRKVSLSKEDILKLVEQKLGGELEESKPDVYRYFVSYEYYENFKNSEYGMDLPSRKSWRIYESTSKISSSEDMEVLLKYISEYDLVGMGVTEKDIVIISIYLF